MAKYKDIAATIRTRILEGQYSADGPLPEQKKLAQEFETSRMTIQKALEMLTYEGLIYSEQVRGTFIKSNVSALSQLDATVNQYVGTTKLFAGKATVKSDILKNELRLPDAEEQEKLQLAKTEAVYDVVRLRFLNEVPYSIEHSIMPAKILGELTDAVLKKSIYEYLEQTLHLKIGVAYRRISADQPNQMDQEYLHCKPVEPVLQVTQTVFLQNGLPFEYSTTRHRYDMGSITTITQGNH